VPEFAVFCNRAGNISHVLVNGGWIGLIFSLSIHASSQVTICREAWHHSSVFILPTNICFCQLKIDPERQSEIDPPYEAVA
jgi:hypothetical protein